MHTWGRSVFSQCRMGSKEFKTIEEQIGILKRRGLDIPDEKRASEFLLRNNYYRISGYSLTLRSHDAFNQGATFQNIVDIYDFDHALRHILLRYIELIEVALKSFYSYEFTKCYGATGYLDSAHFSDQIKYREIIAKAEKQKAARLPHEPYLKHFIEDLHQNQIPLWAYVDLLTISDISFLYSISELKIQSAVADFFGLRKKGAELLKSFMHSLTIIRNLCAHGSRLFNRLFEQKPWLNKKELSLLRVKDGVIDNAHLFGFVLIMKRLLKPEEFDSMKKEIIDLSEKLPFVSLRYYGFCDNWQDIL